MTKKDRNLIFNPYIAKEKPSNQDACPFCVKDNLGKILDERGSFLWLENKYPTLENAYQTLIIESPEHLGDVSNYQDDYVVSLFDYSIAKWQELKEQGDYKSVCLFKNFGPLSGGSLRHPHMQIVGLDAIDAQAKLEDLYFEGLVVVPQSQDSAEFNISLNPIMGYSEFNVRAPKERIDLLALMTKRVTLFLLRDYFQGRCQSYNLFFYEQEDQYICKVIPRFIASPYFLGYLIPQCHQLERLEEVKSEFLASQKR
ncbi:DUF4931 domain-containing protein [Streptococcus oricebi]|uniref:DUF4931 domain-containing protein n=1 Tax=Streptococcus oricebi TaxID=1547447 RepID=A0ABS5B439_9STRE|nr:DUF4931 domain-containing protein [Streptococcus oricebi]MBP2623291.1 DUF4931 domain-containing protein [Streptococcus oricebi]